MPNELNDSVNPHEAGLLSEISFSKGCYIGQEVIARLDTYDKVQRKLKGIIIEGDCDCQSGMNLYDTTENEVGLITSITKSELIKKKIGLAYVKIM